MSSGGGDGGAPPPQHPPGAAGPPPGAPPFRSGFPPPRSATLRLLCSPIPPSPPSADPPAHPRSGHPPPWPPIARPGVPRAVRHRAAPLPAPTGALALGFPEVQGLTLPLTPLLSPAPCPLGPFPAQNGWKCAPTLAPDFGTTLPRIKACGRCQRRSRPWGVLPRRWMRQN